MSQIRLWSDVALWVAIFGIGYYIWKTNEKFRWFVSRHYRNTKIRILRFWLERIQLRLSYYESIFEELTNFKIDTTANIDNFQEQLDRAEKICNTRSYSKAEWEEINHSIEMMHRLKRNERFIFKHINKAQVIKFR